MYRERSLMVKALGVPRKHDGNADAAASHGCVPHGVAVIHFDLSHHSADQAEWEEYIIKLIP